MSRLVAVLAEGPISSAEKRALCGGDQTLLASTAEAAGGAVLIANVSPFRAGRWIFAHHGSVDDLAFLRSRTSPARQRACTRETPSELLFAFLLTRLDECGCTDDARGCRCSTAHCFGVAGEATISRRVSWPAGTREPRRSRTSSSRSRIERR